MSHFNHFDTLALHAGQTVDDEFGAFAAGVARQSAAAERERCAEAAESSPAKHEGCGHSSEYWDGRKDAAAAIRAPEVEKSND